MNNRKRAAQEPLLPIRAAKQPRVSTHRLDGDPASPSEHQGILSRWISLGQNFFKLSVETVFYIIPVSVKVSPLYLLPPPQALPPPRQTLKINNMTMPVPHSVPNTVAVQSRPEERDNSTSALLVGDPSTCAIKSNPEQSANNGVDVTHSIQQTDQSCTLGPSKPGPAADLGKERSKNRSVIINQALEGLSLTTDPEISTRRKRVKEREHIYAQAHRKHVLEDRKRLQEELRKELYKTKRKSGFTSGYADFKSYLEYQALLQKLGKETSHLSSRSLGDLRFKPAEALRVRRYSVSDEDDTAFLQRALANAKATLNSPKPPEPFTPTLEQRRKVNRLKDEELNARFRPKLPASLPPDDEAKVNALLHQHSATYKVAREHVTNEDLSRLKPRQWLNDEIINFYGALILARSEACKENPGNGRGTKPLNVHYFSTFFWSKLRTEGYDKGRLAKWTKKCDLFSKDVALIPVNHNNAHWTCAAINFRRRRIESYDSMGMAKDEIFKYLRAYLDAEHRNKKKKPFDFTGWENYAPDSTPQQENGYDCGVFTCQFLEALSRGVESFIFTQKDMPYLRRRMIWEIGHATLRDD